MRIDAVDGDTVESRILQFGSDPTILAGVTRGPQNDHSKFVFSRSVTIYVRKFRCVYPLLHYNVYADVLYCIKELVCTTFI